jgi:hypothetical protein
MSMADMHGIASEVFSHGSSVVSVKSDDMHNYIGCNCCRWSAGITTPGHTHTIYKKSSLILPILSSAFSRNRKICENSYPYLTISLELSAHGLMS